MSVCTYASGAPVQSVGGESALAGVVQGTPSAAGRGSLVRALPAAAAMQVRYRRTVAPVVQAQLARWRTRAGEIESPELGSLALAKLRDEGSHAKAAAMLATLAPPARRADATEAIVALEVLFDYLDGLSELPSDDPLGAGERLFAPYIDAVSLQPRPRVRGSDDVAGDYLGALRDAVGDALSRLPGAQAITALAREHALLAARAQTRMHAAVRLGMGQVELWAQTQASETALDWREWLVGAASSVLVLHALIAAAADPAMTPERARAIADAYQGACVTLTLLDGIVDLERDALHPDGERPGYLDLYPDREELARTLSDAASRAARRMGTLAHGGAHLAILGGAVAYYASTAGADGELAKPLTDGLRRELAPLTYAMLALMRADRRRGGTGRLACSAGDSQGAEGTNSSEGAQGCKASERVP